MRSIIFSNQPYFSVVFVLLTALYLLPHFWLEGIALATPETYSVPLPTGFFWVWSLSALAIAGGGILINRIVNQKEFHETNSSLPGLVYITAACSFTYFGGNLSILLANVALILAFDQLSRIFRQPRILHESFAGSFWMGVASLFFFPLLIGMASVLSILTITRTFNWREYFVGIAGFLIPWLWYESLIYLFDWDIVSSLGAITSSRSWEWNAWLIFGSYSLLAIAGLFSLLTSFSGSTNKSRNVKSIAITFSAILGIALVIASIYGFRFPAYLTCVPIALILPFFYLNKSYGLLQAALMLFLFATPLLSLLHLLPAGL